MIEDMVRTWAPDDLWDIAEPLIPTPPRRQRVDQAVEHGDDLVEFRAVVLA
ncbi:hypothetical protein [Couchioplanes caeruleus]|uniref:hypothetical protein n=1 Tax=Couchioplanes caeruleus TaxID=56438 RepID=UPI000AF276E0|nr:hypothetical protein [Couchioplanes caeruleus]